MFGVLIHKDETVFSPKDAREVQKDLISAWSPYVEFEGTYLNQDGEGFCFFRLTKGKEKFLEGCRNNVPDFPESKIVILEKM